jgi:hypothetical protein
LGGNSVVFKYREVPDGLRRAAFVCFMASPLKSLDRKVRLAGGGLRDHRLLPAISSGSDRVEAHQRWHGLAGKTLHRSSNQWYRLVRQLKQLVQIQL